MTKSFRAAPLNGLRAFEAAARHLSFVAAADELFVTPGAVSHQIASLESFLGVKLFVRGARSVTLTDSARTCLPLLTRGFATLREGVQLLVPSTDVTPLTVTVPPGFASRWLLPRLTSFTKRQPDIEIRFSTGEGAVDVMRDAPTRSSGASGMAKGPADVFIRFGRGDYPGWASEKLFEAEITAVCAPSVLEGLPRDAGLLRSLSLIHDDTVCFDGPRSDWAVWLAAAGFTVVDVSKGPRFSHTGLALDAAEDGLGLALGSTALTTERPQATSLVAPFPFKLRSSFAYYLVYRPEKRHDAKLEAFRTWLLDESGARP